MGENKKVLEGYLRKLQQLEEQINDGSPDTDLIGEVNQIIDGLTKESQKATVKDTTLASLKFINESGNPDPTFSKEGDSGFDIRAHLRFDEQLPVGKVRVIPTGLYFEVEKGLEVQIRPRSGLAANKGITILNTPGTIDSGYRGEIKIILANLGEFPLTIQNGDRIAQGVVCPVYGEGKLDLIKVEDLSDSERNDGGFGHTGVK
jgi:dUTP pyrophosphatase